MSKTLLEKLKAARATLAAAFHALHEGDKQLNKLNASRASIASQLEQLEAQAERDPEDESAVARLGTLREQQRLLDKKIATLETSNHRSEDGQRVSLGEAENTAESLLIEAARPLLDSILSEARAAFSPFYKDESRLRLAVERNDRVMSLRAFCVNAGSGATLAGYKPERQLSILDRLIAGEPYRGIGKAWHQQRQKQRHHRQRQRHQHGRRSERPAFWHDRWQPNLARHSEPDSQPDGCRAGTRMRRFFWRRV